MKKQIITLAVALLASVSSSFSQGYVNLSSANFLIWDNFTTPGTGIRGATDMDYAIYWAPTTATDPLTAQGTTFPVGATKSTATNGVYSIGSPANFNTAMTGAGFTLAATNGSGNAVIGQTTASATVSVGQIQVQGMTGGTQYQMVVVAWNSSAGASALANGSYNDIGWSNPFLYTPGTASGDTSGLTLLSNSGLLKFGVAPVGVPEPGTMALAALGGASLLLFRRRK